MVLLSALRLSGYAAAVLIMLQERFFWKRSVIDRCRDCLHARLLSSWGGLAIMLQIETRDWKIMPQLPQGKSLSVLITYVLLRRVMRTQARRSQSSSGVNRAQERGVKSVDLLDIRGIIWGRL